jgi:nitroreductase
MDVLEAIATRRSIRRYERNKLVEGKKIHKCLDAARWAPSANNSQPWEFIVVRKEKTREKLASIHTWGGFMTESPVVLCVLVDPRRSPGFYHGDAAVATQNILLSAWAQGLGTCWIGVLGSEFEKPVKDLLKIPKGLSVLCLISMGYPAEAPSSKRKSLSTLIHHEKYGS